MKKLTVLISAVIFVFLFILSASAESLSSEPFNVYWDETEKYVIKWDSVLGADEYRVILYEKEGNDYLTTSYGCVCDSSVTLYDFSYDFSDNITESGDYAVQVVAYTDETYSVSEYSEPLVFVPSKYTMLEMKFEPYVTDETIFWEKETDAKGYRAYIYDYNSSKYIGIKTLGADKTSVAVTDVCPSLTKGIYSVMVTAIGDWNSTSNSSNQYFYPFGYKCIILEKPVVGIDGSMVKWKAVENASSYEYRVFLYEGGNQNSVAYGETMGTSVDIMNVFTQNGDGKYTVSVTAVGDGTDTFSSLASYSPDFYYNSITLNKPTNFHFDGDNVAWNSVENCLGYSLYIYNVIEKENVYEVTLENTVTSVSVSEYINEQSSGVYQIGVKALGNGYNLFDSPYSVLGSSGSVVMLSKTENVRVEKNKLTWNKVPQASYYHIKVYYLSLIEYNYGHSFEMIIDTNTSDGDTASLDITEFFNHYGEGYYKAEICAKGDLLFTYGYEYGESNVYIYCNHIHTDKSWYYDSLSHWKVCDKCIDKVGNENHEYYAEWKTDGEYHWHECHCGYKNDVIKDGDDVKIAITKPSIITLDYGYTLVLHSQIDGYLPEGWSVRWTVDKSVVSIKQIDNAQCMISPVSGGTAKIKAVIIDENGDVVNNSKNREISYEISIKTRAGFFQKIALFFKKLFKYDLIIEK